MTASYPGTIPSFTTKVDQVDVNYADHINRLQDEIVALSLELGALPKGESANVRSRLEGLETGKSASGHTHHGSYWQRTLATSKGQMLASTGPSNLEVISAPADGRVLLSDGATSSGFRFSTLTHSIFSDLASDHFPQYARTDASRGAFLPLAGGTMTGPVTFAGIAEEVIPKGATSGAVAFDAQEGSAFTLTMTGSLTPEFIGASAGVATSITVLFTQDATGNRSWSWPTSVTWVGSGPPQPGAANTVALTSFVTFDGTNWIGIALTEF